MTSDNRVDTIVRSLAKTANLGNGLSRTIDCTRNTDLLTRQTSLPVLVEDRSATLTLLSIYAAILERLTITLVTYTEVCLICFNDTRQTYTVHNSNETITDLMSPQECGVLVDTADFSRSANREAVKEAGDKLFPHGEVFLGVVENTISGNGELFVAMGAIETRATILLTTAFSYNFSFCSTVRTNDTFCQFCINCCLKVRR